jgi:hypothetical protein
LADLHDESARLNNLCIRLGNRLWLIISGCLGHESVLILDHTARR